MNADEMLPPGNASESTQPVAQVEAVLSITAPLPDRRAADHGLQSPCPTGPRAECDMITCTDLAEMSARNHKS